MKRRDSATLALLLVTASAYTIALAAEDVVMETPVFAKKDALVVVVGCLDDDESSGLFDRGHHL